MRDLLREMLPDSRLLYKPDIYTILVCCRGMRDQCVLWWVVGVDCVVLNDAVSRYCRVLEDACSILLYTLAALLK